MSFQKVAKKESVKIGCRMSMAKNILFLFNVLCAVGSVFFFVLAFVIKKSDSNFFE